jgi:hypothetical protein
MATRYKQKDQGAAAKTARVGPESVFFLLSIAYEHNGAPQTVTYDLSVSHADDRSACAACAVFRKSLICKRGLLSPKADERPRPRQKSDRARHTARHIPSEGCKPKLYGSEAALDAKNSRYVGPHGNRVVRACASCRRMRTSCASVTRPCSSTCPPSQTSQLHRVLLRHGTCGTGHCQQDAAVIGARLHSLRINIETWGESELSPIAYVLQ